MLMRPSPKLPTKRSPAKSPNEDGPNASPHGALSNPSEPILLMNQNLTRIPPVDDPNGHALLYKLPLFNVQDPQSEPVAFLTSLRYGADHYLTREEFRSIQERRLQV